jgi:hypothetical protein
VLYRDLGNQVGQASALNGLGFMYRVSSDYRSAAACCQQALELFRGLGNRRRQAYALIHLGVVQQETGDYRAAPPASSRHGSCHATPPTRTARALRSRN